MQIHRNTSSSVCPSCVLTDRVEVGVLIKSSYSICKSILNDTMNRLSAYFSASRNNGTWDVFLNQTALEEYVTWDMQKYLESETGGSEEIAVGYSSGKDEPQSTSGLTTTPAPTAAPTAMPTNAPTASPTEKQDGASYFSMNCMLPCIVHLLLSSVI